MAFRSGTETLVNRKFLQTHKCDTNTEMKRQKYTFFLSLIQLYGDVVRRMYRKGHKKKEPQTNLTFIKYVTSQDDVAVAYTRVKYMKKGK